VADIYGTARYVDFALKAASRMIAFEIDGPTHYAPPDFDLAKAEKCSPHPVPHSPCA